MLSLNLGPSVKLTLLDPITLETEHPKQAYVNKKLIQRYSQIEKVKQAEVIGVLVGTVVVDNYMEIMN